MLDLFRQNGIFFSPYFYDFDIEFVSLFRECDIFVFFVCFSFYFYNFDIAFWNFSDRVVFCFINFVSGPESPQYCPINSL